MVREFPFSETTISKGPTETVIRIFKQELQDDDLKWHWDDEDRTIQTLDETDWMFQYDNQLPIPIKSKIEVKRGVWHRIIKGTGDLRLIVEKHKDI